VKFFHPPHLYCVTTLPSKTNPVSQHVTNSVMYGQCDVRPTVTFLQRRCIIYKISHAHLSAMLYRGE